MYLDALVDGTFRKCFDTVDLSNLEGRIEIFQLQRLRFILEFDKFDF